MASLLTSHLEQISLCATSISDLDFPRPKAFTNALLSPNHDITALIRDTEQHERALFHLAPPTLPPNSNSIADFSTGFTAPAPAHSATNRRATIYGSRQPRNKAVAAVLGGDLYAQTRQQSDRAQRTAKLGEVDVDLLLHGAEKLAAVYPIPGANDKIMQLRRRHQQLAANIAHYEAKVSEQARELASMHRPSGGGRYNEEEGDTEDVDAVEGGEEEDEGEVLPEAVMTREDLEREEMEIKELEKKKKGLEERVTGMERDLGGLMR